MHAVCELMPYSGGLARNIEQCLHDFDIPLKLSHTVVNIHGKERITGVTVAEVDQNRKPIPGTEEEIPCDTLLLSVGLIPENELSRDAGISLDPITGGALVDQDRETGIPGVFACGNVLHVHDLVDFVSEEAALAGRAAAEYITSGEQEQCRIPLETDGNVRYTVPQRITKYKDVAVFFRVSRVFTNARLVVTDGERLIAEKKLRKAVPGEMNRFLLKADQLTGAKAIKFSLEESV